VRVSNDRRLIPLVLGGFAAERPAQRVAAASYVVAFKPPPAEAAPGLLRLLQDPEREVRDRAALALGPVAHERPAVARTVAPALAEALRDPEPGVRRSAASALRYLPGTRTTVPPLVRTLGDPVADVRSEAAFTLGEYGSLHSLGVDAREAIPGLTGLARGDPDVGVRVNAIRALSKFERQAAPAAPVLRDLLRDPSERIRDVSAEALARIERR
jgi:HEAT repeat protein